nr:reverse transcriptase domain-containing protein [Tanacetum cinerariifolium]
MPTKGNDDPPVPDLRTTEELCRPSLNGRGGPIAPIAIQATNFGLKNDMIQQLSIDRCPDHNMLPVTQIDTFYNGLTLRHRDTINAATGGTFMKRRPEECYDRIKNMTAHHNDWDTFIQRMIVQPPLAKLRTYMLREPIIKVDTVPPANNRSTKDVQPLVVQIETPKPNYEPVVALIAESVVAPVSAPKPNKKPSILYPSRLHDQKLHDKVVDFDVDPRVPLILERSFLKTGRVLIVVYAGELTLQVNNEAVTFNLDQTLRYSANYNDMTASRIDVIDMACEEYS